MNKKVCTNRRKGDKMEALKNFFKKIADFFRRLFKKEKPVEEPSNPNDIVCYYGCPNSKKVAKLQTESKILEN